MQSIDKLLLENNKIRAMIVYEIMNRIFVVSRKFPMAINIRKNGYYDADGFSFVIVLTSTLDGKNRNKKS